MFRVVLIIVLGLLLLAGGLFVFMFQGPDLSQFDYLLEPQINIMPDQKMLVVEAFGDPNVTGMDAFGLLFGTYFQLDGVPKGGPQMPPPRARWPYDISVPIEQWLGRYAMPLPNEVTELPEVDVPPNLELKIETWSYGEVAEILHKGSYDSEPPTIDRLKAFIEAEGYEITGEHEEVYLRGPGSPFVKPKDYVTIIRYQVQKL